MDSIVSPQFSPAARYRRSGCDIPEVQAHALFDKHIRLSEASPKLLWKVVKKQGWSAVAKAEHMIGAILDTTTGGIPHQLSFHAQFASWCAKNELCWTVSDTDRCIYDLRKMMMMLLRIHNCQHRQVPRKCRHLAYLLEKFGSQGGNREVPTDLLTSALPIPWSAQGSDLSDGSEAAVEVPEPHVDVPIVNLIDDSEENSSSEDVMMMLPADGEVDIDKLQISLLAKYRIRKKSSLDGPLPGAPTDHELASLFDNALHAEHEAPTPNQYTKLFKRPGGKVKSKSKNKQKTKKKAPTGAMIAKATAAGDDLREYEAVSHGGIKLPGKVSKEIPLDVLVSPYLGSPINSIFKKRVYSNAWHKIRKACLDSGVDLEVSKELACIVARQVRTKWARMAS